jgi:hypothetical protein
MNDNSPSSQEFVNKRINDCIPPGAWKSNVGIIIVLDKTLRQFGTGTLLRVADASFLVTAAHVIKEASKLDKGLCITASDGSFVQVHGNWMCSSEGQYETTEDPFDIAVLQLDYNIVERLKDNLFLRLDDVNFDENLSNGIFCLFGYPSLLSQPSINADTKLILKPFQYATSLYEGKTDMLSGYQNRFHLLLGANPKETTDINGRHLVFVNREGIRLQFPENLGGISGCSVWMVGARDIPMTDWGKTRPRVVAVQTGVYSNPQIIKTTRWVAVSTLLHEAFPELRPALSLWHVR